MAQPVVHFEIIGNDPQKLRDYYAGLFGWEFQTPSPVAHKVSEPGSYGFLDLVTSEDGTGIRGGVGGGPSYRSHAVSTWSPERRGCAAARREPRRHTGHGSSHIT